MLKPRASADKLVGNTQRGPLAPHLTDSCPNTTMSTTSTADNPDLKTTNSPAFAHTSSLGYAVTHVFLPVKLPDYSDYTPENDLSLARAVCAAAHAYSVHVYGTSEQGPWCRTTQMLDNLQASIQSEPQDNPHLISQLRDMRTGGTPTSSMWIHTDKL